MIFYEISHDNEQKFIYKLEIENPEFILVKAI